MRPSIISVSHQPGRGLVVVGRFTSGHIEVNVFPQATRRTSRREFAAWMFGARLDERCARCEWRARSTQPDAACVCVGHRPGNRGLSHDHDQQRPRR